MNFEGLRQAVQTFDEIMPIGRNVEEGEKTYHIAGMTRKGNQARMYVLSENITGRESIDCVNSTNRTRMRVRPDADLFMEIAALKVGETELKAKEINGYCLGYGVDYDCEELLLFTELMKAGWQLPEGSGFAEKDWREMWVTHIDFDLSTFESAESEVRTEMTAQKLPRWENQEILLRLGKRSRVYPVEEPVELAPEKETEVSFTLPDGRRGICYINRVYPMDVWQENEERFKDPRYLEIMTEEELKKVKEEFFLSLAEDCPKGMCYLGIEYECTLEGNLMFYDRAFLESVPEESKGSTRVMMMLLKAREPWGKHGFRQHGCVIQRPVLPDIRQIEAELFSYVEMSEEKEVRVKG